MEINFDKKFNVGLTLRTTLKRAEKFFAKYARYIDEVYFSLPLGDRFHSRKTVCRQFKAFGSKKKFWKLLKIIKSHGIKLEMVLNTGSLTESDVTAAKDLLAANGVEIDSVCFMDEYYSLVEKHFPDKLRICSYNNLFQSLKDVDRIKNDYDRFVLGGALIRSGEALDFVHEKKNAETILLLNNGCSFNCRGCRQAAFCEPTFKNNLKHSSLEYLYALQSILPHELYDGTVCVEKVDKFKISNRSSGIGYLFKCIDSYMNDNALSYIKKNKNNLALWCRLGQFWGKFTKIDVEKMLGYKSEIIGHKFDIK